MLLVTPGWMFAWAFLQRRRGFPVGWDVTRYPQRSPSCFQSMFPQMPRPALAARGLCFGALQTLVPLVVVFPLGFCRGVGLLACRVKPSGDILVFTLLSWGCPELVRAPRYCHTRIYNNESCVSTWRLCKTCTRFQEEVTESFPWEGIGRFLQRDSSKSCLFFQAEGRACPEWGGCDPSPDARWSPRSSLWWSRRARAAPGARPSRQDRGHHQLLRRHWGNASERAGAAANLALLLGAIGFCCLFVLFFSPSSFCLGGDGSH